MGEKGFDTYIEAKSNLNKINMELMGNDLDKEIEEIEKYHSNNQVAQSWRLIRVLAGKGSSHVKSRELMIGCRHGTHTLNPFLATHQS